MRTLNWLADGESKMIELNEVIYVDKFDVIVVGAGTAGSIAAVKLASLGHKVLVIEKKSFMGGIYSSTMFQYYRGSIGGIYEKFDAMVEKMQDKYQVSKAFGSQPMIRRVVYDKLLEQYGANIEFNAVVVSVYKQDQRIEGIQYLTCKKKVNVEAKVFIDATADASLCRIADLTLHKGREFDGLCQPFSNVRLYYDFLADRIEFNNIDAGTMKQENPEEYSKSVIDSTNNSVYSNPQEHQFTLGMSPIIGIREGFSIDGLKKITMKEIVDGYISKEPLYYSSANFDNHTKEMAFESEQLCDWVVGLSMWSALVSVPIEKEVMIPKGIENIMAIGRMMSLDHDIASHTRMMRDCQKSGEASAIVIDSALRNDLKLADVKYSQIKSLLEKDGCLNEENNYGLKDNPPPDINTPMWFPETDSEIVKAMKSDRPGFAMLAAYRGRKTRLLKEGLQSNNQNMRVNSGIVLALLDDNTGHDILVQAAKKRDSYKPMTSKSYNMLRGLSAVYCLGRLHQKESYSVLYRLLQEHESFIDDEMEFDKFIGSRQDYHFQYVAHIVRALVNIADHNEDMKDKVTGGIHQIVYRDDFKVYTSLKSNRNDLHDMTFKLREFIQWKLGLQGSDYVKAAKTGEIDNCSRKGESYD